MKSITYYSLYCLSIPLAILPLRILYILADIAYLPVYYIIQYRKEIVLTNLRNSFPEKSEKEIKEIAKKFYRHFIDLFVETIKMLHFPEKELQKRIKLRNPEIFEKIYKERKLVFVALGHYNNWEWISMMTRPGFQVVSIYKTLHNPSIDRFMFNLRTKRNTILVSTTQTLRFLNSWKGPERTFFCFIADQSPLRKDIHYWTKFLNQSTPIFIGIEKIAVKMDVPVCFFRLHKPKRGHYELEIIPIVEQPSKTKPFEITEAHVRLLEEDIIKRPEFWLWSHRRWKRQPLDNETKTETNA
ncbi:MAG TPA: lysophospholipid acyltransferase family protein [Bacteroidales bacterium]|nr:lysophospholipid acyltransferase family protein [Bacteroidales bacterium]